MPKLTVAHPDKFRMVAIKARQGDRGQLRPMRESRESRISGIYWQDETWSTARMMGESHMHASKMGGGIYDSGWGGPLYDVRLPPVEALAEVERIEAEIRRLELARRDYIAEHFTEWPIAHREDFSLIRPTERSKAEVVAEVARINAANPKSAGQAAREKQMLRALNKAMGR